jgi:flagellar biosynthesis/type III secretory pathway chaperone
MTEKTGLFRRLEAFEKLIVAANAEATVAVAYLTEREISEEFGQAVETLAEDSEQLRQKVGSLLDAAGNENLDL